MYFRAFFKKSPEGGASGRFAEVMGLLAFLQDQPMIQEGLDSGDALIVGAVPLVGQVGAGGLHGHGHIVIDCAEVVHGMDGDDQRNFLGNDLDDVGGDGVAIGVCDFAAVFLVVAVGLELHALGCRGSAGGLLPLGNRSIVVIPLILQGLAFGNDGEGGCFTYQAHIIKKAV